MTGRIYFPVGEEASVDVLKHFDWKDMQQRSLNDPRFAGCEPGFDWHKYIELRFNDDALAKEVSDTLDQFAKTPEGQQTIRQAHAMQNYRIRTGQTRYAKDQKGALYITDKALVGQTAFMPEMNAINVFKDELLNQSMLGVDGHYHHTSLQAALYHELCHAKDGFDTKVQEDRYYNVVKRDEFAQEMARVDPQNDVAVGHHINEKEHSIEEYPVILETNAFMQKYYGEVPRALVHDAVRKNTFLNELLGRTQAQAHLPEGLDYNNIPNLPVPNCKAPAAKSGQIKE